MNELAAAVKTLFGDKEKMRAMSREARLEFEARYTAAVNIKSLTDIYRAAINNRRQMRTR